MPVDENELNDLTSRFITDLGATVHAGNAAAAGFTRIRRATETPFNIIYEVRP